MKTFERQISEYVGFFRIFFKNIVFSEYVMLHPKEYGHLMRNGTTTHQV
jgi:hypothetical protein